MPPAAEPRGEIPREFAFRLGSNLGLVRRSEETPPVLGVSIAFRLADGLASRGSAETRSPCLSAFEQAEIYPFCIRIASDFLASVF